MSNPREWRVLKDGVEVERARTRLEAITEATRPHRGANRKTLMRLIKADRTTAGWGFIEADGWRIEPVQ